MKIKASELEVLSEKLLQETLLDFFEKEGIESVECLKRDEFVSDGYCDICDNKVFYKSNFDYLYRFDELTNMLVKCDESDEEVIKDFVFYVCKECNKVSYYIE